MKSLSTPGVSNPQGLTMAQVTSLINHTSGYEVDRRSARFSLVDRTLQPINIGQTGPTGDTSDVSRWIETASITHDTTQSVHRTLTATFHEQTIFNFNPLIHQLKVFWDYWDPSGNLLLEVPLGVFAFPLVDRSLTDAGNVWTLHGHDATGRIANKVFLNNYVIAAGTNYLSAITTLLTMSYLPKSQGGTGQTPGGADMGGPAFPTSRIVSTPTSLTLPADMAFSRKDNLLTAINTLLAAINYYPIYADCNGTLYLTPLPWLQQAIPALGWTYTTDGTSTMQAPILQTFTNANKLANAAVVWAEHNSTPTYYAVAYNTNRQSSISLNNLQDIIPITVQDDLIPSTNAAQARASLELQYANIAQEQVEWQGLINPLHDAHEYVAINVTNPAGVPEIVTNAQYGFEETAWSVNLATGLMKHIVGRQIVV